MVKRWFVVLFVGMVGAGSAAAESGRLMSSAGAIEAHLTFLADDLLKGRDTGSPEYEIAARYVAAQFQSLGFEPAGDDGTYLQAVPFLRNQVDADSLVFEVDGPTGPFTLEWKKDFLVGGDAVRPETSVTAPVVFVGHGVAADALGYNDYDGVDVEGKIVMLFGGAPASLPHNERAYYSSGNTKLQEAVSRGAVGVISLQNAERTEKYPWERSIRNAGRPGLSWLSATGEASDYFPQIQGSAYLSHPAVARLLEGSGHTLAEILEAEASQSLQSFELPIEVTMSRTTAHEEISAPNVAAILRGADPELRNEYIVYTAHLDHIGVGAAVDGDEIYNGAYDNAMGTSVLLEVARLFSHANETPRRSILFLAVAGEEKGLLGAEYFARYPTVPVEGIVANINLDMPLFLFPVADVVAFGAEHSSLIGPVERAAEAVGFTLSPDPMPEEVLFIRSDQYAFIREGVPSIFFVTGMTSRDSTIDTAQVQREFLTQHYHMPSDDLSRPIHWDSARRFTDANFLIGLEVANTPERPTWNEGDFFGDLFGR